MAGFSPAFQLYPKEWLSSGRITMMTPEQEGVFIRLLLHQWEDPTCTLPDDDAKLAILSRLGERWLKVGSTSVKGAFVKHPTLPHRIYNERLYRERIKQEKFREQCKYAGVKSGKVRSKNRRSTPVGCWSEISSKTAVITSPTNVNSNASQRKPTTEKWPSKQD